MNVILKGCVRVALPSIRPDSAFGFYILSQKCPQAFFGGIGDQSEPEPPGTLASLPLLVLMDKNLHCPDNKAFMLGCGNSPAFLAFCGSTEERFISFDQSGKLRSGIMNHSLPKTVKQVPGRVMTPKTQLSLKLERADARRKSGDVVGCREPVLDRNL
jgi:hypothetical protein